VREGEGHSHLQRRREQLGERLLLEDGARVLLEREMLDGLAQCEQRLVDVRRLLEEMRGEMRDER